MKIKCPACSHEYEISPAAILGKEGGKKSRRSITPEQQAELQAARKKKKEAQNDLQGR